MDEQEDALRYIHNMFLHNSDLDEITYYIEKHVNLLLDHPYIEDFSEGFVGDFLKAYKTINQKHNKKKNYKFEVFVLPELKRWLSDYSKNLQETLIYDSKEI